ncbi:hypothetical protein D4L85_32585 [Chryseolinea soli]|uniref:Uncharacterized protein n=1 Tax=Chryseolinea soli TaxID=2321403 RepID=A0A385SZ16_9BACT|nr:hypothetical protein D4L85_32585 [Chryseolinea soli]
MNLLNTISNLKIHLIKCIIYTYLFTNVQDRVSMERVGSELMLNRLTFAKASASKEKALLR